jgi:acyl-CoA dehydrogenase
MDFTIPERTQIICEMMDEFVKKELFPLDNIGLNSTDWAATEKELGKKREMVKKMELWAPNHPKEFGGMGLKLMEHAYVSEVLGQSSLGHYVFGCQAPDAGNIEILHQYGTDEQKEKYLRPLVEGEIRSCFYMTEVDMPGSNPTMLETTAVKDGDDYVINGHKWYSSSADGAEFAVVMAVTNPENSRYLQASMILVPLKTEGVNLVRNIPVMGHVGAGYFSHGEILYQNVRVPQKNILGGEGQGFVMAQDRLGPGRIHHCMRWLGICNRALDMMCRRAVERTIAPGKKLADKEVIQSWIAECAADIQAARLMVIHAGWKIDQVGASASRKEISMIKYVVANTLQKVLDRAIQLHGGLGMSSDIVLCSFWTHERGARIYDGADEVHKASVAKQILKAYRMG